MHSVLSTFEFSHQCVNFINFLQQKISRILRQCNAPFAITGSGNMDDFSVIICALSTRGLPFRFTTS
ncbi:hypothetical protein Q666_02445 [Marinobacter sp. ES-1]|nr:hypothetical protein Q666_02445 [Marinobacter sp. ES-1]